MKLFATILFSSALSLAAQVPAGDVVRFLDGSQLHGRFVAFKAEAGVQWKHDSSIEPFTIAARALHRIQFEKRGQRPGSTLLNCRFRFNNDDELLGNLEGFDEDFVWFQSWFAGRLKARRDTLKSIKFFSRGLRDIYSGPNGLEGWNAGDPRLWRQENDALVGAQNAFLGRSFDLPDRARIEFKLGWEGALNLYLSIYSDTTERFNFVNNGYQFNMGLGYVNVMRGQGRMGMLHLGQGRLPTQPDPSGVRIEIRADRKNSLLALLANDQLVGQWTDRAGFVSTNRGVSFFCLSSHVRLSEIRISEWDGELETPIAETNEVRNAPLVKLVNQDKFTARIGKVVESRLEIVSDQATLKIPLARIREILFPIVTDPPAQTPGKWVQARVASGEKITLELAQWNTASATGEGLLFGPIRFETKWVDELRFNPDQEPMTRISEGLDTSGRWLFE